MEDQGKSERHAKPGQYLVHLYNATKEQLDQLVSRNAETFLQKLDAGISKSIPKGVRIIDLHHAQFKETVRKWLLGELLESDYHRIATFVGDYRELAGTHTAHYMREPPLSVSKALIAAIKSNPTEPFTQGYRELLTLMLQEDGGTLKFKPRWCTSCGRMFLPIRKQIQTTCSRKCNQLLRQHRYLERRSEQTAAVLQKAGVPKQFGETKNERKKPSGGK